MADKIPSPCIDVCKFKREGRCIGCSMSKSDKKAFKKLRGSKAKRKFLKALVDQQNEMGKYSHWRPAYQKKCIKKGTICQV
jgi:predicted Fe-S protein YdhL (DUF1289 family)